MGAVKRDQPPAELDQPWIRQTRDNLLPPGPVASLELVQEVLVFIRVETAIDAFLYGRAGSVGIRGETTGQRGAHPAPEFGGIRDERALPQSLRSGLPHRHERRRLVGRDHADYGRHRTYSFRQLIVGRGRQIARICGVEVEKTRLRSDFARVSAKASDAGASLVIPETPRKLVRPEGLQLGLYARLVSVLEQLRPEFRAALRNFAREMDRRLDVAERVVRVVRFETVLRREAIEPERGAAIGAGRPREQVGRPRMDGMDDGQDVETRVPVELRGVYVGLQILIEGLA